MLLDRYSGAARGVPTCLCCGIEAAPADGVICRRCGEQAEALLPSLADLAECPICYREPELDGRFASLLVRGARATPADHQREHDRVPVGDDDHLESLREGDRIRVGRFRAPFDLVRRYLVTGLVDGGLSRRTLHDSVVTAMTQLARWGQGAPIPGDQPEWRDAREAIGALMERYHRGS